MIFSNKDKVEILLNNLVKEKFEGKVDGCVPKTV